MLHYYQNNKADDATRHPTLKSKNTIHDNYSVNVAPVSYCDANIADYWGIWRPLMTFYTEALCCLCTWFSLTFRDLYLSFSSDMCFVYPRTFFYFSV